eukprot:534623-Pleurochrysis_carterae.AAC.4
MGTLLDAFEVEQQLVHAGWLVGSFLLSTTLRYLASSVCENSLTCEVLLTTIAHAGRTQGELSETSKCLSRSVRFASQLDPMAIYDDRLRWCP